MSRGLRPPQPAFRNLERQLADPDVAADPTRLEKIARERARLEPLVLDFEELQGLEEEQQQSRELLKESRGDAAMEELAQEDLASLNQRHAELTEKLTVALLPRDPRDERSVMLEIRAGAGGDEACIWAGDLARMYERYSQKLGWNVQPISSNEADLGGFRELILSVKGDSVFSQLKFEAGCASGAAGPRHRIPGSGPHLHSHGGRDAGSRCGGGAAGSQGSGRSAPPVLVAPVVRTSTRWKPPWTCCTNPAASVCSAPRSALSCRTGNGLWKSCERKLLEQEQREAAARESSDRRAQVGSGDRSEKIRTYNYKDNRTTDHRLGRNFSLDPVLDGQLEDLIGACIAEEQRQKLEALSQQNED